MKRLLVVLCGALTVILAAAPALAFDPQAFNDYESGWGNSDAQFHWAQADIDQAARYDIFRGYDRGTHTFDWAGKTWTRLLAPDFRPAGRITRAEFAAILSRVLGLETYQGPVAGFEDVSADNWFGKYVASLVSRGIIKPAEYQDSKLVPNDPITRVEIAVWTARAGLSEGLKDPGTQSAFGDVNPDHKYFVEISTAAGLGIVRGYGDGTFGPDKPATRAEAAAMIMRLVRRLDSNPPKIDDLKQAVQDAFNALTEFQKKHREAFPEDDVFISELGDYFAKSTLQWYSYPQGGKKCDGLGTLLGGGGTVPSGFLKLRVNDPMSSYGERTVLSAEPAGLRNRWADVKVTFINQPRTYDLNPNIPQLKAADIFHMVYADGRWKISGMTPIGILEKGFNLK